ncbi:unnamed protein product, partial [Rotaria magnacalcarata]
YVRASARRIKPQSISTQVSTNNPFPRSITINAIVLSIFATIAPISLSFGIANLIVHHGELKQYVREIIQRSNASIHVVTFIIDFYRINGFNRSSPRHIFHHI